MSSNFSLAELAESANAWCAQHRVVPANGQAGETLTERNLRYYRTLGLLDAPEVGSGKGYGEKHRLQLIAVRLLQAQGLPLNRIRSLLYARSLEDLQEIERRGLEELEQQSMPLVRPSGRESWSVYSLDSDFMLISRRGGMISEEKQKRILEIIHEDSASSVQRIRQNQN